eukprot:COSAG03_NODE_23675_length_278_cov_0.575419_1_plen_57_part_10
MRVPQLRRFERQADSNVLINWWLRFAAVFDFSGSAVLWIPLEAGRQGWWYDAGQDVK